ncbi:hypothetical protein KJ359_012844 [Pestalotiopsis sp. 9143b]|nr:hypothetical protein KJ359_012844 [Pestalotiopsis sp. 9143b]
MASAFARTLPSSLSSRTLFIKCSPAPSTFTERRAILKALATTGADTKIEVFKKLEDSSSFIAVTTEPESARSLVSESPYQRIVHLQDSAKASLFSTAAWGASFRPTITDPVNVQPAEEWREGSGPAGSSNSVEHSSLGLTSKTFTIHVFPANPSFSHKRAVELNPLHGPWPRHDGYDTYVSMALKKAVPGGRMSPGLRDWDTGKQISQGSLGREDEGAESLLGSKLRRSYFIEKRRRKAETELPDVMKSLAAVAKASTATLPKQTPAAQDAIKPPPGTVLPVALGRVDTQSVPSPSGSTRRHNNDLDKDKPIAPSDFHDMFKGS